MENDMVTTGLAAYATGGIIILLMLLGMVVLWLRHRSHSTTSRLRPYMQAALEIVRQEPGRWNAEDGAKLNLDLDYGTFHFCTMDCAVKGIYKAMGQAAVLLFECGRTEFRLHFHGGVLIGASLDDEIFVSEHPEVRFNEPLGRKLLDEVRKATGFQVIVREETVKVYSKNIPKPKEEKEQTQDQRRKRR